MMVSCYVAGLYSMQKAVFQIVWKRRLSVGRHHDTWKWTITKGNNARVFSIQMWGSILVILLSIIIYLRMEYSESIICFTLLSCDCLHLSYPLLTSSIVSCSYLFLTELHIFEIFQAGERILCRHPFLESKRAYVVPQHVEELLHCYWPGSSGMDVLSFTVMSFLRKTSKGQELCNSL